MRKKTYQQPTMKVVKVEQTGIICTSQYDVTPQNESYVQEEETVVNGWYN
ncbi:MAG: hypothetical protein KBT39_13560 [Bacteroidales bacterium]|nr:hypothetical protein [Bacteroidales bacterium]